MVKKEAKEAKETEEEKQKKYVIVGDISQLYAKPNVEEDDYIVYNDNMKVPFKFKRISWPLYNKIVRESLEETSENPDSYDRTKQEKIMKEMITEVAGTRISQDVREVFWTQFDSAFCESLRQVMFDGTGEMRVSGALLKNLMPNLNEEIEIMKATKRKSKR